MEEDIENCDLLPPHSVEGERGVLGCVMIDPHCLAAVVARGGDPEMFYDLRHQTIFSALTAMQDSGEALDTITLQQWLKDRKQLEGVGGIPYLMSLADAVPSSANLKHYLDITCGKHLLRRVIQVASKIISEAYAFEGEPEQLVARAESEIMSVNQSLKTSDIRRVGDGVMEAISTIEGWMAKSGETVGLPTGIVDLDKMTGGLHPGEMIVLAARPSCGKTSLMMNIVDHISIASGHPVGVFSLEMTYADLVLRSISSCARVNLKAAQDGMLTERDFPRLTTAAVKVKKANVFVDDAAGQRIDQIRAKARRMVSLHGVKFIAIDYLQLVHATPTRGRNREQDVAEISAGIKSMAKELGIPVMILAQLNRDIDKDKARRPRLSDIRESGSIEQDADKVMFLYKPGTDEDEEENVSAVRTDLLLAKQRNGPTGNINLVFLKQFTRFESMSRVEQSDIP